MKKTVVTTIACAVALFCAACSGSTSGSTPEAPATSQASSSPSATPSPSASATPSAAAPEEAAAPADRSNKHLKIVFSDSDLTAAEVAVLDAYTQFEADFGRARVTGKVPADLDDVTKAKVHDLVENTIAQNKKRGLTFGGTTKITVEDVTDLTDSAATVVTCQNAKDWVVTEANGAKHSGEDLGIPTSTITVKMTRSPGGEWRAASYDLDPTC